MIVADCAPFIAPTTLAAVIRVESGGNALALHVNGLNRQPAPPRSKDEAVSTAERFMAEGYSVDLGRMQVNSRHLAELGLSVGQMLEPRSCDNIRVGADILAADYGRAATLYGEGQDALLAALAAYNSGSFYRARAYVARYVGAPVPALARSNRTAQSPDTQRAVAASVTPYTTDTVQSAAEWKQVEP